MSALTANARTVFVAECFVPASGEDGSILAQTVAAACTGLRSGGADLEYLGALLVPDDEIGFHLFAAADTKAVLEVSRRAGLQVERIVESVAICYSQASPRRRTSAVAIEPERPVAHESGQIGP